MTDKPVSGEQADNPIISRGVIYALYAVALIPFVVALAIKGFSVSAILFLSLLVLFAGYLLGLMHKTFGLVFILALGFFNALNPNLPVIEVGESTIWWLGLGLPITLLGFYLNIVAIEEEQALLHLLTLLLVAGVVYGALATKQASDQLPDGYLWTAILMGAWVLLIGFGSDHTLGKVLGGIGVAAILVSGPVVSWQWYDLFFSPNEMKAWLDTTLQILFAVVGTAVIWAISAGIGTLDDEGNEFGGVLRYSFLCTFLILVILFGGVKPSLLASIISIVVIGILLALADEVSEDLLPYLVIISLFLVPMLATIVIIDRQWISPPVSILLFDIPVTSIDYFLGVAVVASIIFSISGFHWVTFISACMIWVSIMLSKGFGNLPALQYATVGIVIGMFIGMSRFWLWPFLSAILRMQLSRIRASESEGQLNKRLRAAALLELKIFPKLTGRKAVYKDFVAANFQYDFKNQRIENEFSLFKEQAIAKDVLAARSLKEALKIARSYSLGKAVVNLADALETQNSIEQVRQFADAIHSLGSDAKENAAKRHIVSLAYQYIKPVKSTYYAYDKALRKISPASVKGLGKQSAKLEKLNHKEISTKINNEIQSVEELTAAIDELKKFLEDLSSDEQTYHQVFTQIGRQITSLYQLPDLQERSRTLQSAMLRITDTREKTKKKWRTIAPNADKIVSHPNPWASYFNTLYKHIDNINRLNGLYINWANRQVVKALAEIHTVEDLAAIDDNLSDVTELAQEYGGTIDLILHSLQEVKQEASAAIAFPRGFNRRMGLQDTLDALNKLRSILGTRYQREAKDFLAHLDGIAEMLLGVLHSVEEEREGGFRNPYQTGNPIKLKRAALFKGRQNLAQNIVTMFRGRGNPTIILYGARRMGKTSFLLQLPRLLPGNFLPAFLDMQEGGAQQNDASFMHAVAKAIYRQLKTEGELKRPDLNEFESHPYTTLTPWIEEEALPILKDRLLFLTIDEFELIGSAIARGSLTVQVLGYLRHLMQHNENIILMFSGVQTIEALGPNPASYFITANPVEMSYLDDRDAEELIVNPDPSAGEMPEYSDDVISEIIGITRCQPYLIQALCSEIIITANAEGLTQIKQDTLDLAISNVLSGSLYFQDIWNDARKAGQALLKQLVVGSQKLDAVADPDKTIERLLHRRVIAKSADESYSIEIPLVATWIKNQI